MKLKTIAISEIKIPPDFCRKTQDPEYISELAKSIESLGLLQPILVYQDDGFFELVAGSCRLAAIAMLNLDTVPAVIYARSEVDRKGASLVENILRDNLNPLEEAEAVRFLADDRAVGIPELARILGKSESWVRTRLDIVRMHPETLELLGQQKISIAVALILDKIDRESVRKEYLRCAALGGCTKDMAQRWVSQYELDRTSLYSSDPESFEGCPISPEIPVIRYGCDVCNETIDAQDIRVMRVCPDCQHELHKARSTINA